MISLPSYNLPLSFKQFVRNYFLSRPVSETPQAKLQSESVDLTASSFLIISADPFINFVFGRYIEKWNGKADIATTEEQAAELLLKTKYNVVLVDVKKEDAEISDKLLNVVNQKKQALVALVDEKTEVIKATLIKAGVRDWLEKEADPEELSRKLLFYTK